MTGHQDDLGRQPSAAEWRMLRAIMRDAMSAARHKGQETVEFRGFRLVARQMAWFDDDCIGLAISCQGGAQARLRSAVARLSGRLSPWPDAEPTVPFLACCRCDFLAGCVSPIDARNASPRSGQIS